MRRALSSCLAGCLGLGTALTGCGSILFKNPSTIRIQSNVVATAKELEEGHGAAVPGSITLNRRIDHTIVVSADGYEPQRVYVSADYSWWRILFSVVLNGAHGLFTLFISTVIGCGVDLDSGAWQQMDD